MKVVCRICSVAVSAMYCVKTGCVGSVGKVTRLDIAYTCVFCTLEQTDEERYFQFSLVCTEAMELRAWLLLALLPFVRMQQCPVETTEDYIRKFLESIEPGQSLVKQVQKYMDDALFQFYTVF